jgi:pimeloyl-ACP methyl ester carboxylesterase
MSAIGGRHEVDDDRTERYRRAERALWRNYGLDPAERFVDLATMPYVRIRVQELGAGAPVLFVHGGPNAGSTWAPLVAAMDGFHCFVIDRPGCALSSPIDYSSSDLQDLAADVLGGVLDGLGLASASVVASSIGGTWTFWFARRHPARVNGIVQMGSPALLPGMRAPSFMRLASTPVGRLLAFLPAGRASTEMSFRQIGHGKSLASGRIPDVFLDWYVALVRDTDTMRNELAHIRRATTWRGPRRELELQRDDLVAVQQRTLFVWGPDDPFNTVDDGRWAVDALPRGELEVVDGGGHLPWLDDPSGVAARTTRFLQSLPA